ncbi:DUF4349 domain-containing protein [Halosegnis marinus]|uniref:DUF4349 domain-containing protein n=1 Tax=Halosegnis marinus TaxID=3034023 RepID=A0ABD5ZJR3_9EURY|nr:DUF4349 domain-containing protein [Halosegnis sp. DT85]
MRRTAAVLALVLLLALAGCSGGSSGPNDDGSFAQSGGDGGAEAADAPAGTATAAADTESTAGDAARADRAVIRTGTVSLTVDSYANASARVTELARDRGGYVAASTRSVNGAGNTTWTTGSVTIRVPAESFGATFDALQTYGEVREATSDTTDVTDRLVDIEARLETLRAERDRLRDLYEDANDTDTVLRVSEELSEVQTEMERLTARQRSLENRVAYSTLTVALGEERPDEPTPTPEPGYADTGLGQAFAASIDGVVTAVKTLGVTVAYALPYLLAFGVPLAVVGVAVARTRRR